ncbi:hypothetical protein PEX2_035940 [Penicillium expansum]|uniref:Uncharacterized protein n=1 Tax=Penicillium expansum TaxID=27334 RepID=A0A0A2JXA1_PENEN|nr:hypothetical protein PEX2_035940 [Penicillium expansum]KGO44261.1 hypothetical protein PEXP_057540 [Penicillium expansum]KGO60087.1 hypothetical protein PEX2_035940 [Penicillium expansum]
MVMEKIESQLEHKALENRVRAKRKKFKNMPTIPITDLDPSEIPHHFNLTQCLPTEFELSPSKTEKVFLPPHLNSILVEYDVATGGSPTNEALIRSRIDVIILTTLAKMKRELVAKPHISVASSASPQSVHLQFGRKIEFIWKSDNQRVRLSGIINYSLWYGMPDEHATNMAMIEAERPDLLKGGMLRCLAYMAMIHETRKRAKIPDTSVCGIATDSFEWVFIRIRPNGEWTKKAYHWVHSAQEIVSMLEKILAHAAGFDPQTGRQRWNHGPEMEFSTLLKQPKSKPKPKPKRENVIPCS